MGSWTISLPRDPATFRGSLWKSHDDGAEYLVSESKGLSAVSVRAVIDTSSLVPSQMRRELQQAAQLDAFIAIWSPWIIAELNRVLVWRWINDPPAGKAPGDLSRANERRCAEAAKRMMELLLPCFELVNPLPPYPLAWETLTDTWDHPVWAAAKLGRADYVVSENTNDYPSPDPDRRHVYEGIEYIGGRAFLALLTGSVE